MAGVQQCWNCGTSFTAAQICHLGSAGPGRSSAALSCGRLFPKAQICHPGPPGPGRSSAVLSCGRLFRTLEIWNPGPAGPGRSSAALSCSRLFPTLEICHPGLQVLAGAQQRQFAPYTAHLPSRTCRSQQELSNAGAVADCSPHWKSAI